MENWIYIFVTDAYAEYIDKNKLVNIAILRPKWGKIYGGRTQYLPIDMPKKKAIQYLKERFPDMPKTSALVYYDAYNINYERTHPKNVTVDNMLLKDC